MKVRHLFISPGHNYVGHHGREPGRHPVLEVPSVECVAGRGLRGDRFFDHQPDFKGQVTLFSWEVFQQLQQAYPGATPDALRRNVVVDEPELGRLIGAEFTIQGIRLYGTEECRPCYWMDRAVGDGAEGWLRGRGGLRCRILSSGTLIAAGAV